jgi:hypothetical protein
MCKAAREGHQVARVWPWCGIQYLLTLCVPQLCGGRLTFTWDRGTLAPLCEKDMDRNPEGFGSGNLS